jgi:hypothetical protein
VKDSLHFTQEKGQPGYRVQTAEKFSENKADESKFYGIKFMALSVYILRHVPY